MKEVNIEVSRDEMVATYQTDPIIKLVKLLKAAPKKYVIAIHLKSCSN